MLLGLITAILCFICIITMFVGLGVFVLVVNFLCSIF